MSEERDDQERPCLHCMIVELIDTLVEKNGLKNTEVAY
jgi:hypothetical protein